jgi:signal transduction histidine kinase/HAMP domain-containing protein
MRLLYEPAVRVMNRLKYVYKFALIGFLIVMQASVLIYLLVAELNKNIDFAARERLGLVYNRALIALLNEAQGYRSLQYSHAIEDRPAGEALREKQAKVDAALEAVAAADRLVGPELDTTWKLQVLRGDWEALRWETAQFGPDRASVAFELHTRWLGQITALMQHAGYSSNLALDTDLDTAYLSDSVLRKLPLLIDALGQAEGLVAILPDSANIAPADKDRFLAVAGLIRSTLLQADQNAQTVFRRNEMVRTRLKALNDTVNDSVPIYVWNFEQKADGTQGRNIPRQLLMSAGNRAIVSTLALYNEELNVIEQLIDLRITRFSRDRNIVTGFTISVLLLMCYLFLAFDMSVRKGVYQLNTLMDSVAKGDLSARGAIHSQDEMGSLTRSINSMLQSLETMYEQVRQSRDRLEIWNQELERKVAERTASLRNLLDHAGQGFLSFGDNLLVAGEYSAECVAIFKRDIAGATVAALFYPDDGKQQTFLEALFRKIFTEQDALLRDTYFTLLPDELVIDERHIGVAYKVIENPAAPGRKEIMLILTDRTEQKALEAKMQEEKDVLAMVVRVVTHAEDFFTTIRQYSAFCLEELPCLLNGDSPVEDKLATVFRTIHTFKGTFGQLGLRHAVKELHELEGFLTKLRAEGAATRGEGGLAERFAPYPPAIMLSWLDEDIATLKDTLGESFFAQEDTLVVDGAKLLDIEEKIERLLAPAECRQLVTALRGLRYKPFKELLQAYPEYVINLADKYGKMLNQVAVDGGETPVDPIKFGHFAKSLGHVFRNAVIHGLESPDERLAAGKDENGSVNCRIHEETDGLIVTIADDGRGIDPRRIREVAVNKGICDEQTAASLADEAALELIFADGFTGADEVDELAGRGVGLSAVRSELVRLGGSVKVNTAPGGGTEFRFFLPLLSRNHSNSETVLEAAKPLLDAAKDFLAKKIGLTVREWTHTGSPPEGKLPLRKITTFVDIKGIVRGKLVVSADEAVVKRLATIGAEVMTQPDEKWLESILAQSAIEIFNEALARVPCWDDAVKAETIVTILAEDASANYPQAAALTWTLDTGSGRVNLSLLYY